MTDTHYIDGSAVAGTSGRQQDVYNPATGAVVGSVPLASTDEVNQATFTCIFYNLNLRFIPISL